MTLEFYKGLVEYDLNPFILFNNNGKIIEFNTEAEFLLNYASSNELYNLAINNAPKTFGFEHKYLSLKYGKLSYYAILIGYLDDETIGLKLYQEVDKTNKIKKIDNLQEINIFHLIDISKTTTFLNSKIKITEIYDISIPELKLNIDNFLLTLNELFSLYTTSTNLTIEVYIKIGVYEIINKKKHSIIVIQLKSDFIPKDITKLEQQASKSHINTFIIDNIIKLEFPMIL